MKKLKKFFKKLADIQNALRVLEIMDKCGCNIEKVTRDGLDKHDYWKIISPWYVSGKDAEDLMAIVCYKQHYKKRSRLWKIIFPNVRDNYRFL